MVLNRKTSQSQAKLLTCGVLPFTKVYMQDICQGLVKASAKVFKHGKCDVVQDGLLNLVDEIQKQTMRHWNCEPCAKQAILHRCPTTESTCQNQILPCAKGGMVRCLVEKLGTYCLRAWSRVSFPALSNGGFWMLHLPMPPFPWGKGPVTWNNLACLFVNRNECVVDLQMGNRLKTKGHIGSWHIV